MNHGICNQLFSVKIDLSIFIEDVNQTFRSLCDKLKAMNFFVRILSYARAVLFQPARWSEKFEILIAEFKKCIQNFFTANENEVGIASPCDRKMPIAVNDATPKMAVVYKRRTDWAGTVTTIDTETMKCFGNIRRRKPYSCTNIKVAISQSSVSLDGFRYFEKLAKFLNMIAVFIGKFQKKPSHVWRNITIGQEKTHPVNSLFAIEIRYRRMKKSVHINSLLTTARRFNYIRARGVTYS